MVNRLIKQKEGAALCDQQCQLQAGALSEGQSPGRTQGIVAFKQELVQEVTGFCFIERRHTLDGPQGMEIWIQ